VVALTIRDKFLFFAFLLYLLYGKKWLFVFIINGNIKPCEVEVILSVSSLTMFEHIPKSTIPTVENTENIITPSAGHNKITA
jgi:cellulose synthase/poly-beta-1,6-N-acetylglucosamine synthase-like glycosyltransferase